MYGALSDRIGRRPLNLFSVVFTAAFAFPFFLLLAQGGGRPWLVACWMIFTATVSFVAFVFSRETRHVDITAADFAIPQAEEEERGVSASPRSR